MDGLVAVLGQFCKGHAVAGENGMNLVGKGFDHATKEVRAVHLAYVILKLNISELGYSVYDQEHIELALGQAQPGNVNVHLANFGRCKLAPSASFDVAGW